MIIFFIFALGLSIGSFINALVYRLHEKKPIVFARSACPACAHSLSWRDLIPLVSFALLLGRCRYCQQKISWQYPLVELITGIAFILPFTGYGGKIFNFQFSISQFPNFPIFYYVFVFILLLIFTYDLRYMLIPDSISIPSIIIVFLVKILTSDFQILNSLIAAAIASGFFLAQFVVSRGRWIGGGDIRLGFLTGLMLGWPVIIASLMLAYIFGAVVTLPLVASGRHTMKSQIPFGAFLTLATIAGMVWGERIVEWYLALIT